MMQQGLAVASHPFVSYALIYLMLVFIFNNMFRVRKLPILKEILIYLLLALGAFILLIFQIDKLPIIPCLFVVIAILFIVRIRYFMERRKKATDSQD